MAIIELGTETGAAPVEAEADWIGEPSGATATPSDAQAEAPATPAPPARRRELTDELSAGWALVLTVAWIVIFTVGAALEPAPANPDAMPFLAGVLASGLMIGWLVMAAGFAQRRRYGAAGSLGAAGVLVAMTVACPLSGHHAGIGAWWWFEVAGSLTLLVASRAALLAD
jgi:hypothetical protein